MPSPAEALDPAANPDLFGHEQAVQALERAMASSRLHHGWLISGRRGIGKATLAYRFARALLAGQFEIGSGLRLDPDHPVFQQIAGRHHPDLHIVEAERDPKTGKVKTTIPIDRVREATASLSRTPAIASRHVLVVDGAEQLNRNAANALLKPLEEPPAGAVLILISHRPGRVPATLRSRCAKLALHGLSDDLLLDALTRHAPELDHEPRQPVLAAAKGSLGRALDLAGGDWLDLYERVLRAIVATPKDPLALDDLATSLAKISAKHGFANMIDLIQTVFGRITAQATGRLSGHLFSEERTILVSLAGREPLDRWASLWEKTARLSAAVDGLNLDHSQALAQILTAMAAPPVTVLPFSRKASSLGSALLGASPLSGEDHVVR